jgi:hypothetical protein
MREKEKTDGDSGGGDDRRTEEMGWKVGLRDALSKWERQEQARSNGSVGAGRIEELDARG